MTYFFLLFPYRSKKNLFYLLFLHLLCYFFECTEKRLEFEKRRKLHYNEFEAIKLARKLIEEDEDDVEDGGGEGNSKNNVNASDVENTNQATATADVDDEVSSTVANEIDMDNENS